MKRLSEEKITALHGAGGLLMEKLIAERILPKFKIRAAGPIGLDQLDDGAVVDLPPGKLVVTTDSHVVKPLFFPGGDIGKLAVTGTVNDLVVMGARPLALTLALVLEEGFSISDLEKILESAAAALSEIGVALVTGDTKVMGKGELDGIVINTTGVGVPSAPFPTPGFGPAIFSSSPGQWGITGWPFWPRETPCPWRRPCKATWPPFGRPWRRPSPPAASPP